MLEFFVCYLVVGLIVTILCEKSLMEQAERTHAEMCLEAGGEVPYWIVVVVYQALAVVGWPFFLVVSVERRKK